jgi:nucleoside-diphosphate-sugar epimerase
MKLLVTGAHGFLGRSVVAAALAQGHTVRALARPGRAQRLDPATGLEEVAADLLTTADLRPACAGVDAVLHLAAALHGDDASMLAAARHGTERLLDALAPETRHVVLVSSLSVYDWSRIGAVLHDDSQVLDAQSARLQDGYARAKLAQEAAARAACAKRGLGLAVLRPAMLWGPGRNGLDAVGPRAGGVQWIVQPERTLRLSHVDNCASACIAALDARAAGLDLNVEDGHQLRPAPFAAAVDPGGRHRVAPGWALHALASAGGLSTRAVLAGRRVPGLLIPARFRARFHPATVDPGRLRSVLGWHAPLSFEQALQRTATRPAAA